MTRTLMLGLVLTLGACNRAPVAGSPDDKSAQGESMRRAVATVDAAATEASTPAPPLVPPAAPAAAKP
jgi:hypothetical protein